MSTSDEAQERGSLRCLQGLELPDLFPCARLFLGACCVHDAGRGGHNEVDARPDLRTSRSRKADRPPELSIHGDVCAAGPQGGTGHLPCEPAGTEEARALSAAPTEPSRGGRSEAVEGGGAV